MSAARKRRAHAQLGGPTRVSGEPVWGARLAEAFTLPPTRDDDPALPHVHGFHAYPGRMHPELARRLVLLGSRPGETVLDPFCGSGTVLVEAVLAGRHARGYDINPLAIRLARLRTTVLPPRRLELLRERARAVVAEAPGRGYQPAPSAAEAKWFAPHVLRELAGLRAGIAAEPPEVRELLELVLSAILIKVSRQRSDTSLEHADRALARGFAGRLFVKKTDELETRWRELAQRWPPRADVLVTRGDARELRGLPTASVQLVVTSPPYGAVYDYAALQARRAAWLGLAEQLKTAEHDEIGARARGAHGFDRDLELVFGALRRVLCPGGLALVVQGDGSGESGLEQCRRAAARAHFTVVAAASQRRRRGEEHVIMLR